MKDDTADDTVDVSVDVSIVIPARDCRTYLDRCLTSALVQRVVTEIVVVDDGSTDGTTELLGLYAEYHRDCVKVIRLEGSGGPGRPRNVGLDHAGGRYVFFLDADDYLGPEALERMVAVADANGSDIVLGKIVGHGRRAPASMFHHNADRAELGASAVYNSLSCFKLFRREMLEHHHIRFPEERLVGEDIYFTVHAYCHAATISVVADYDCYHLVARADGSSIMQQPDSRDPVAWLYMVRDPIRLMTGHVPPGPLRDHLLLRHFKIDVFPQLGAPFLEAGEVRRKEIAQAVAALCDQWLTPGVHRGLTGTDRQRLAALGDVDRLARLADIECATVLRRLTGLCWDGERLAITVAVELEGIGVPDAVSLVLRTRDDPRRELVVRAELVEPGEPVVAEPVAGHEVEPAGHRYTARVDVAALGSGIWDVRVSAEREGVLRTGRLGADRDGDLTLPAPRLVGGAAVLPYFTRDNGNLSVDVGGYVVGVPGSVRITRTRWSLGRRLLIDGEIAVAGGVPPEPAVRRLVWRERGSGRERAEPVTVLPGGGFAAGPAVGRLPPGTWDAYLELDLGGPPARFRIETDAAAIAAPRRWLGGIVLLSVRPYATSGKGRLSTVVRQLTARAVIRRMMR
ncbi:glycosyltransferase family 2 protein [Nonomuraea sp. SBT364]|uniref:glycosyltransferase family 2 protein n=1 Tax=Nonomuraea sp. SBT364 TaxID=1580530 RepID=UPI00066CEB47|nr:glycosyltransferase family 2 protein [Nonomuraea sp. SBT364]